MTIWICATCGVEHADTEHPPTGVCAICADDRQWVPESGQEWTTHADLAAREHRLVVEELEPGLHRFNRDPRFGIGQWSYLVHTPAGNLLWDPPNHLDEDILDAVREHGGAAVIAASHPHMFGAQVSWSHRLGNVPVLVNADDRDWVRRADPVLREWRGVEEVLPGVRLIQAGGHFPGAAVAHLADHADGRGVLLSGDTIVPVVSPGWVTFMRSYPNAIPLSAGLVRRIGQRLEPYDFDRLHGLLGATVPVGAKDAVRRSVERYVAWVSGANDHLG